MKASKHYPLIVSAALLLAGCSLTGIPGQRQSEEQDAVDKMNMQDAADQAESILDQTAQGIKPPVEWGRGPSSDPICTDWKNDATGTGQVTRRRHVLTIVSEERRGSFIGVVERNWKKSGYRITSVNSDPEFPAMFASTPEGFKLMLTIGHRGQAYVDVSSPCVTESEVADPPPIPRDTPLPPNPNDPEDPTSDEPFGLPYLKSDFWSATTPISSPTPSAAGS
ncbi:hypothetical protein ABZ705_23195 [Streptomyces sp. NPDC006984]|uniref:hypothetical protein n=1 Tax=Streptomyces sp. NPDC006984 TaxID=3155463 RepID=UPI0033F29770